MSDKENKDKRKKSFEEQIYDTFPDDLKPNFKPHEYDPLNDTPEQILDAMGIKDIFKRLMPTEADAKNFEIFFDQLVKERTETFNQIREGLKDDEIRRHILKGMGEAIKHGK
jgi:hypothetical protein